jgi:hypothetical protein
LSSPIVLCVDQQGNATDIKSHAKAARRRAQQ